MTAPTPARAVPRWRLTVFWLLMAGLLFLHLGEHPERVFFVVTAFGDLGALATHEIHVFALSVFVWVIIAAVVTNLRRPADQVGAAWTYTLGTVLAFGMFLVIADADPEMVGILSAAIVVALLAFAAHPSPWRRRFARVDRPSVPLFGLLAIAAIPLVVYATGQIDVYLASGDHDEHFVFGHWIIMAIYALLPLVYGVVAALKVPGWRLPLWAAGAVVAALGVGSLGITAVSQLRTVPAVLAIVWGVTFIAVGELEARRQPSLETSLDPAMVREAAADA